MSRNILLSIALWAIIDPFLWQIEENPLMKAFQYLDEILGAIGFLYIVTHYRSLTKNERGIFISCLLLISLGLIGTLKNQIQTAYFPVMMDAFTCIKCFTVFIYANHSVGSFSEDDKHWLINKIGWLLSIMMVVAFFCAIINLGTGFMSDEYRFGIPCFRFLLRKSSTFSNMFYIYMLFLTLYYRNSQFQKRNLLILIMAIIVYALTARSRAVLFAAIYSGMFYWFVIKGHRIKANIAGVGIALLLAIFIAGDRMESTFDNEDAPRTILMYYGVQTMMDYMPLGAGLATYGTDMACKYYSPLYYDYGFQYAYGLNPDDTQYAHDCYWPAIMGEFGVIGVIVLLFILYFIVCELYSLYRSDNVSLMLVMYLILVLGMASLPTSVFFKNETAFLFLFIPLIKRQYDICKN